jgi:PhnB protein
VFGAAGTVAEGRPTEVVIGDSLLMISPDTERARFPAFLYSDVHDADQAYQRALAAGARSIEAPLATTYGDHRAMVTDPFGNTLQIAHREDS